MTEQPFDFKHQDQEVEGWWNKDQECPDFALSKNVSFETKDHQVATLHHYLGYGAERILFILSFKSVGGRK